MCTSVLKTNAGWLGFFQKFMHQIILKFDDQRRIVFNKSNFLIVNNPEATDTEPKPLNVGVTAHIPEVTAHVPTPGICSRALAGRPPVTVAPNSAVNTTRTTVPTRKSRKAKLIESIMGAVQVPAGMLRGIAAFQW